MLHLINSITNINTCLKTFIGVTSRNILLRHFVNINMWSVANVSHVTGTKTNRLRQLTNSMITCTIKLPNVLFVDLEACWLSHEKVKKIYGHTQLIFFKFIATPSLSTKAVVSCLVRPLSLQLLLVHVSSI